MKYNFEEILKCEMCESNTNGHKIIGQRLNCSQGLRPKSKSGISITVKKCYNCNLIYTSPQPTPHNISDHYGMPAEEYWHGTKFEWEESYFKEETEVIKELVKNIKNPKALDIGAGLGKSMITLEKAGFNVYGFEPSVPFYNRAIEKMGILAEKLKLGMIEELDYDENSFDFITFGAVVEHLYHPATSIEKALKWLKIGGYIHIEVPNSNHLLAKFINFYYKLRGTNYVTHTSPMHSPFHLYEFDLKSFEMLGKKLNFSIVRYEYMVGTLMYVPKFLYPIFKFIMRKKPNMGLQLIVWLQKNK
jgi:2-polyprenyl-3-methyl-5-hydroxy-6-metoxy-1,4-benzoquinol methylase